MIVTRVYLLGAGFSRAVSAEMPLTKELSKAVEAKLRGRDIPGAGTPIALDFERWLTYLIERPPWLNSAEQERNRAAFLEVSNAVHAILTQCQVDAVESQATVPTWLQQLVEHWQHNDATVITFNYDNLAELAWRLHAAPGEPVPDGSRSAQPWTNLYPMPIPPVTSRFTMLRNRLPPDLKVGMSLLKLHGSLTWRYAGLNGASSDLIYETAGILNCRWNARGLSPIYAEGYSADLEPMIVPPTAAKSPYYTNGILRANWKLAAKTLRGADELVIMGFSLPPTDLLVSSMLVTTLRPTCRITPVDFGTDIVKRIRETLDIAEGNERLDSTYAGGGDVALAAWVDANIRE